MILISIHFALALIGIIIGGFATLATIIFAIIALVAGKNKNAIYWGIGLIFSVSIVLISFVQLVKRIEQKVKSGIEWVEEHKGEISINTDDDYKRTERQLWIDTLKSYVNDDQKNKIPAEFYANKVAKESADGSIEMPFVYPYSIRYNTINSLGELMLAERDSVFLRNVSQIAFDNKFIIARVDNSSSPDLLKSGHGEIEYILFDMRSGEYLTFVNQEQLMEKSKRIGYTGAYQLHYLSGDYSAWINTDYE